MALYGFQTGRIFCANSPSQQARGASYNLLLLLRKDGLFCHRSECYGPPSPSISLESIKSQTLLFQHASPKLCTLLQGFSCYSRYSLKQFMSGGRSGHHTVSSKRMSGAKKTIRVKTCSDDRIGCWDNRKCQLPNDFGLSVQEQPMHFQCIVVECPYQGGGSSNCKTQIAKSKNKVLYHQKSDR